MKSLLMRLLRIYKRWFSPALTPACRYLPTCSEYALEAVERHGCWRGSLLTAGRLLRCQPWGGSGYDPVPASFLFSPYGACENAKMGRASKVQEGTVYQPSTRKPRVPGTPYPGRSCGNANSKSYQSQPAGAEGWVAES